MARERVSEGKFAVMLEYATLLELELSNNVCFLDCTFNLLTARLVNITLELLFVESATENEKAAMSYA